MKPLPLLCQKYGKKATQMGALRVPIVTTTTNISIIPLPPCPLEYSEGCPFIFKKRNVTKFPRRGRAGWVQGVRV